MSVYMQYICLTSTHCNQQYDHKHCYTFTLHCWHMPLKKYAYHITYVPQYYYCSKHIFYPHYLTNEQKQQQIGTLIYHAIATYKQTTNMPLQCHTCQVVHSNYQTGISAYIPHINSLQSTMSLQAKVYIHFTLLAYAPD